MKFSIAVLNCTKCLTKTQKYFYKLSGATSKENILVQKLQSNYMFSSPESIISRQQMRQK